MRILCFGDSNTYGYDPRGYLARKRDIPFIDTRSWNIELTFDGIHFTGSGHHTFAHMLAAILP